MTPPLPWEALSNTWHLFWLGNFSQYPVQISPATMWGVSSHPASCYLEEKTDPHLATVSSQAVENDKVPSEPPEPPVPQTEHHELLQLFLIRLVLETLPQLCRPSLHSLWPLNVLLVMRRPKLDTGFDVWPHQCWIQEYSLYSASAGHTKPFL